VLTRDLPALEVEGVAVAVAGREAEAARDVIVLFEVAQLLVVRNVAPEQEAADRAPCRAFGPERAGVQPLETPASAVAAVRNPRRLSAT
jgi:hypothetical protein